MKPHRITQIEKQRTGTDCSVCALAMLLDASYNTVWEAAISVLGRAPTRGLYNTECLKVATKLGIRMRVRKRGHYDLKRATGLLPVTSAGGKHMVALFRGVVVDPKDGALWEAETYLKAGTWEETSLLEVVEAS